MTSRRIIRAIASALLLASLVVGVLVLRHRAQNTPGAGVERGATEAAAMVAARDAATAFFTIDPAHVVQQIDDVLKTSTGAFLREYSARKNEAVALVRDRHRTVTASVPTGGIAIASYSEKQAVVLVAVDQTSTEGTKKPVLDHLRVLLEMSRTGSVWKTAALDQLGASPTASSFEPGALPGGNTAVLAAAASGVQHLLSIDYRTMDTDLAATIDLLTISFASEFAQTFSSRVRSAALAARSVTVAYVRAAGLVVRAGATARCLVYVDQVATAGTKTTPTASRLFVDLQRVRGKWRIAGLGRP